MEQDKHALRRKGMKNFMELRRNQIKNTNESQGTVLKLNQLIHGNDSLTFLKVLQIQKPDFVYNYLISQDDLLKTPISLAFEQKKWYDLLKSINAWSMNNMKLIQEKFQKAQAKAKQPSKEDNSNQNLSEIHIFLKNRFAEIIRCICTYDHLEEEKIVELFSQNNTLLSSFMKLFLNRVNLKSFVPFNKQLRLYENVFTKIANNLGLQSLSEMEMYLMEKKKQKTWDDKQFIEMLSHPSILNLEQIKYNFMHELTTKKDIKYIYQIIDKMESVQPTAQNQAINIVKQRFFCQFDGTGQTPIDIILSKWEYQQIKQFIVKSKQVQCIHLSINSLNKIICNKKLRQEQVEEIVQVVLSGPFTQKGYSQRITKQIKVKQKILEIQDTEYCIVMDKRRVFMAKDKRNSYPLLNYLDRFENNCSIKMIELLFFQSLDRQVVKAKIVSLLKQLGKECKQLEVGVGNQALKQISQIVYYHQSLLSYVCRIKNSAIIQYFINRMFINYFEIVVWGENSTSNRVVHLLNRHFLTIYIELNSDLSDTPLNKAIIEKVFKAKDSQKFVNDFNLYVELARQFYQYQNLQKSSDWFVKEVKMNLKKYIGTLQKDKFIQLKTYINQGRTQKQLSLLRILPCIYQKQEVAAMNLPQEPQQQKQQKKNQKVKSKKKQKYLKQFLAQSPNKVQNNYKTNKDYNHFQIELKKTIDEANKRQPEIMVKQEEIKQKPQQPVKLVLYGQWQLDFNEPDLEKKIQDLIQAGFIIRFRLNKLSGKGSENIYQKNINQLKQPYKAICLSMISNTKKRQKSTVENTGKSLQFHRACLLCSDEQQKNVFNFLKSSPPKFKDLAEDWQFFQFQKIHPNIHLLLSIIENEQLRNVYKINQAQNNKILLQIIKQSAKSITSDLKLSKQLPKNSIKKMIALKKIKQILLKQSLKIQKQQNQNRMAQVAYQKINSYNNQNKNLNDNDAKELQHITNIIHYFHDREKQQKCKQNQFSDFMRLHSQKSNLKEFYETISVEELYRQYGTEEFVFAFQLAQKPIDLLKQLQKIKESDELDIINRLKKLQAEVFIQSELRNYQVAYNQKFGFLTQDGFYFHRFADKIVSRFCSVLEKMSQNDFQQFLKISNATSFQFYKKLILHIKDENRCLRILNELIIRNNKIGDQISKQEKVSEKQSQKSKNISFIGKINRLIKIRKDKLNAALCAFINVDQQVKICPQNPPAGKISLDYSCFIQNLTKNNYEIYVSYLCKMLMTKGNYDDKQKYRIIFDIFSKLFGAQAWEKCIILIDTISKLKELNKQKKQLLKGCLDICSKNTQRVASYKEAAEYQKLVNNLFSILAETNNQPIDQSLFKCVWDMSPQKSINILKPLTLSLQTMARCLQTHPSKVGLIKNVKLDLNTLPSSYRPKFQGKYIPFSKYDANEVDKQPYLIDLLIFQQQVHNLWVESKGQAIKNYTTALQQKKKSIFMTRQAMKRYKELYNQNELNNFSYQIFNSNILNSLKDVPKDYVQAYFKVNKQIKGVSNLSANILRELIDDNYVHKQQFFDIIRTCKIDLIDYFLKKIGSNFNYQLICSVQEHEQEKLPKRKTSFIVNLIRFENRKFVEQFIKHYKIFDIYPPQKYTEMTKQVLWQIPFLQGTSILKLFLQHLKSKTKDQQIKFRIPAQQKQAVEQRKAELLQQQQNKKFDGNSISEKFRLHQNFQMAKESSTSGVRDGIVFLPLRVAALNGFYQYYFLLLQQSQYNVELSVLYENSNRFYFECNPQQFSYIPLMKKKVQLFKLAQNYFHYKSKSKQFLHNLLRSCFFGQTHKTQRCCEFLSFIFKDQLVLQQKLFDDELKKKPNSYVSILCLKCLPGVSISDEDLIKKYPQQAKFVIQLLKHYPIKVKGLQLIHKVLKDDEPLRQLLYIADPKYLRDCGTIVEDAHLFSYPFGLHIRYFEQPQNIELLEKFATQCFFKKSISPIQHETEEQIYVYEVNSNFKLMRDLLLCCLISRNEGSNKALSFMSSIIKRDPDQFIIDCILSICNRRRTYLKSPMEQKIKSEDLDHNPAFWNSFTQLLKNSHKVKQFKNKNKFKPFFSQKYADLLNLNSFKSILQKSCDGLLDVFACQTYLCNLMYLISEQSALQAFVHQQLDKQNCNIQILYGSQLKLELGETNIKVHTPVQIIEEKSALVRFIRIDSERIIQRILTSSYIENLHSQYESLKQISCLSKLRFKFDIESFKNAKSLNLLRRMISADRSEGRGINKIIQTIDNLKNLVQQQKNSGVFNLSDVHGPIQINDQTDKQKVVECINFYELCLLPDSTITIKYSDSPTIKNGYSKAFSDIKQYIRFFTYQINDDQFENKSPYKFNSVISLSPSRNDPETEQVVLDQFYLHNIISFFDKVDRFGCEISSTFNHQIVAKYSISSIVHLLELYSKNFQTVKDLFSFVSSFLGDKRNIRFIEAILIMIMEDANNIMKVVKGILIFYDYQQNPKTKVDRKCYKINSKISIYDVGYKIEDQIFTIKVIVGPSQEKSQQIDSSESGLISRKDFLNTVFSSTQFLTGYFINKSVLANELVKLSKQISQIINSEVNFSINYKQLYNFIDKIKDNMAIKDIDGLLTNLNAFITFNLKKFILNHLDSRELALQHQLALLDCFQQLNSRNRNVKRDHQWYKVNTKIPNENGINYTWNFSTQLKQNDKRAQNIKNVYLVQIYRSYVASIVSQGMCFILGFKSHQPSILIKLQKKEDFDKVNITELSFILLVSNRLPTSDQINYEKVIKIFVTDLNQNVYQLDRFITQKLLQLPSESQNRNLAHMVPVLPENIILVFNHSHAEKSVLNDDKNNKYIQLNLTEQGKFKLENKNKFNVQCIDLIKIDNTFNNSVSNLKKAINSFVSSNIVILVKAPSTFEPKKAIEALEFCFIDFQKCLNNIFTESLRNKEFQLYASAQKSEQIRQNLIYKLKSELFMQYFDTVSFQVCEQGKSRMVIQNKKIKIQLVPKQLDSINSTVMSDTICKYLIKVVLEKFEKIKNTYKFEDNFECLVPKLQHLLMGKYQIEVIEKCLTVLKKVKMQHKPIKKYRIEMKNEQKSKIKYENQQIIFTIRLNNPDHQFYSDRKILQYIVNGCSQIIDGISSTKYNPNKASTGQKQQKGEVKIGQLQFNDYDLSKPIKIILISRDKKKIEQKEIVQIDIDHLKSMEIGKFYYYYLISKYNEKFCVDCNYIWETDPTVAYVDEKKISGLTHQQYNMILSLPKTLPSTVINMSECNISIVCQVGKNKDEKQITQVVNITRKSSQFDVKIRLLSKETMLLQFIPLVSGSLAMNFEKYKLFLNQEIDKITFVSNSCKEMVEQNTKFVQLIFRKNSIKPFSRQFEKKEINILFNEPAEKIEMEKTKNVIKSQKNIESMVYIINEKAIKFLTRAGEERIDIINACDEEGNVTKLKPGSKIWFRHLNIPSQIIIPTIKQNEEKIQLYWSPKIRGPYEAFVNSTRLNPSYEIGVCSASAEIPASKVQIPKKTQICFGEQTQLSIQLKDSFGNIYTQFEETKKDDHLIIELVSDNVPKTSIKMKSEKIDKYGLKKIRFSIDDPTCNEEKNTVMTLSVNMVKLVEFKLKIKGQSLSQRRKNLQKQIQNSTKRYYFDISVSRKNFIECLFKYAEQGLDKNFSVKFAGEQGIDAGGLKREFYDMIGKQLKDPNNPFFVQTDMSRHNQYFINPEIVKNKKKEEYFELFGKYLANSFINGYMIGVNFSNTFVKLLYEDPITFDDMLAVLPKEQAKMYESLINADAEYIDDLEIYFSYVYNRKKGIQIQMVENGKEIKVTKENVKQYLQLLPEFLIVKRYADIVKSFKQGFNKVLKLEIVRRWIRSDQFWCMTAGVKQITPQIVLANITIQGGKETHHAWIRAYISEASKEILEGFLKFSSGSSSIDFYQTSKITVKFQNQGENPKKLPISHTCWKQIDIPAYKTYAIMKQLLNAAFLYCSQGFGFG